MRLCAWTIRAPVRRTAVADLLGSQAAAQQPGGGAARGRAPRCRARAARASSPRCSRTSHSEVVDDALLAAGRAVAVVQEEDHELGCKPRLFGRDGPDGEHHRPHPCAGGVPRRGARLDRAAGRGGRRGAARRRRRARRARPRRSRGATARATSRTPRRAGSTPRATPASTRRAATLLVFVDDDVEVRPGWLAALLAADARAEPDVGVLTGPIHARFEDHPLRSCGREDAADHDPGPRARRTATSPHAWGANMTVRRCALERAGRFDESRELYGDEQEWQQRLHAAGGRIRYVAAAALDHRRAGDDARLRSLAARRLPARARRAAASTSSRARAPSLRARAARARRLRRAHRCATAARTGSCSTAHSLGRLRAATQAPTAAAGARRRPGLPLGRERHRRRRAPPAAARRRRAARPRGRALRRRRLDRAARARTAAPARARARHRAARAAHARRADRAAPHAPRGRDAHGRDGRGRQVRAPQRAARRAPARRLRLAARHRRRRRAAARLPRPLPALRRGRGPRARPARPPPPLARRLGRSRAAARRRRARDALRRDRPGHGVRRADASRRCCRSPRCGWAGASTRTGPRSRASSGWPVGVVDATPILHTTPVGGGYARDDAVAEARAFLAERPYVTRASRGPRVVAARCDRERRCEGRGRRRVLPARRRPGARRLGAPPGGRRARRRRRRARARPAPPGAAAAPPRARARAPPPRRRDARSRQPPRATLDGIEIAYVPFLAPPRPRSLRQLGALGGAVAGARAARAAPRASRSTSSTRTTPCPPARPCAARRSASRSSSPSTAATSSTPSPARPRAREAVRARARARAARARQQRRDRAPLPRARRARRRASCGSAPTCPPARAEPYAHPTVVTTGHLIARKRHADVLRAIAAAARPPPAAALPRHRRRPRARALRALAAELGIADRVEFAGQLAARRGARAHAPRVAARDALDRRGVRRRLRRGDGRLAAGDRRREASRARPRSARWAAGLSLVAPGDVAALAAEIDAPAQRPRDAADGRRPGARDGRARVHVGALRRGDGRRLRGRADGRAGPTRREARVKPVLLRHQPRPARARRRVRGAAPPRADRARDLRRALDARDRRRRRPRRPAPLRRASARSTRSPRRAPTAPSSAGRPGAPRCRPPGSARAARACRSSCGPRCGRIRARRRTSSAARRCSPTLYRDADAVVAYGPHVAAFVRARGARNVHVAPQAVDNAFWGAPRRRPIASDLHSGVSRTAKPGKRRPGAPRRLAFVRFGSNRRARPRRRGIRVRPDPRRRRGSLRRRRSRPSRSATSWPPPTSWSYRRCARATSASPGGSWPTRP